MAVIAIEGKMAMSVQKAVHYSTAHHGLETWKWMPGKDKCFDEQLYVPLMVQP